MSGGGPGDAGRKCASICPMPAPVGHDAADSRSLAVTVTVGLCAYLVAVGAVIGIASWTYGFFAVTDIGYYRAVAERLALGLRPYRDFPLEYPPLALVLLALPQRLRVFYPNGFAAEMFLWGAATAVFVSLCSAPNRSWAGRLAAPLAYALGVVACGAVLANRYDVAVAFTISAALWALARRRHGAAAAMLGLGFALKLTPALLLPLVLVTARRRWSAAMAFGIAGAIPFLPFLGAPHLIQAFLYHAHRPLQFESVLATPFLLAHLVGLAQVQIATTYGSQTVVAPGADLAAQVSGVLQVGALGLTYWVVSRRRALARPEDLALAALGVLLAFVTFGKVLSPQFLIWILPAAALTAVAHPIVAASCIAVLGLTQVEFPGLFRDLLELEPLAIGIVATRNAALVVTWGLSLGALWRLPAQVHTPPPISAARRGRDA